MSEKKWILRRDPLFGEYWRDAFTGEVIPIKRFFDIVEEEGVATVEKDWLGNVCRVTHSGKEYLLKEDSLSGGFVWESSDGDRIRLFEEVEGKVVPLMREPYFEARPSEEEVISFGTSTTTSEAVPKEIKWGLGIILGGGFLFLLVRYFFYVLAVILGVCQFYIIAYFLDKPIKEILRKVCVPNQIQWWRAVIGGVLGCMVGAIVGLVIGYNVYHTATPFGAPMIPLAVFYVSCFAVAGPWLLAPLWAWCLISEFEPKQAFLNVGLLGALLFTTVGLVMSPFEYPSPYESNLSHLGFFLWYFPVVLSAYFTVVGMRGAHAGLGIAKYALWRVGKIVFSGGIGSVPAGFISGVYQGYISGGPMFSFVILTIIFGGALFSLLWWIERKYCEKHNW